MKKIIDKILLVVTIVLIGIGVFGYSETRQPYVHYKVYLDSELMGTIASKKDLEKYINSQAKTIRDNVKKYQKKVDAINTFNKFNNKPEMSKEDSARYILENAKAYKLSDIDSDNLKNYIYQKYYLITDDEKKEIEEYIENNKIYTYTQEVFTPNGIKIEKTYTYDKETETIPEIYKRIISKKSCTIAGYKFTIKLDEKGEKTLTVYTIDEDVFNEAIEDMITIFVNEEKYKAYKSKMQREITTTGSNIENIYLDNDITYKAINISVEDKIFTNSKDLSAYLLYGDKFTSSEVEVQEGDSIDSISLNNKISVQEFLIFNPTYTSRDNLLVPGSKVKIAHIDPKLKVVVETYEVVDRVTNFNTIEQYNDSLTQGSSIVTQEGENGLERVAQNVKSVNGEIAYVDPVNKETLKAPVSKIVSIGTKYIPTVGSLGSWGWPTASGYTLSSYYGYRLQIFGEGNFHSGIDIAGTGYGSPVYASNNGVIAEIGWDNGGLGWHVLINHNNGYYTAYGHMAGFVSGLSVGSTVARGQQIGYVGSSGWATGPHLHFEVRTCAAWKCHTNPAPFILR